MTGNEQIHGGVRFSVDATFDLGALGRVASRTLEDSGHSVERCTVSDDREIQISSNRLVMTLSFADDNRRLVVSLLPADGAGQATQAKRVMLLTLSRLVRLFPANEIEWLKPTTRLTTDQLLVVLGDLPDHAIIASGQTRQTADARFLPVEETARDVSCRYDELSSAGCWPKVAQKAALVDEPVLEPVKCDSRTQTNDPDDVTEAENDIRRLATWGMTGVVTCLSGPVGLSMIAVNLLRGEDFRLNTHVLALTGFLCVATSSGAVMQLTSALST